MMLTSIQLKQYITNYSNESLQQYSIDLRLMKVERLKGKGHIKSNTTLTPTYVEVGFDLATKLEHQQESWVLEKGFYKLTFLEGVKLPNNVCLQITHRSSLLRNGSIITSGLYDPNFYCDNVGAFMQVNNQITIDKHARVATIKGFFGNEVSEDYLYNGQWQGQ